MLTATELAIQRRATKQFIDAAPKTVILSTVAKVMVAGTASFLSGGSRDPQIFRLVWLTEDGINERPPDGTRRFDFALIGEHDAEISIGDFWKEGDQEFRIENMTPSNGWEVKAYGISHGPKPS
jgi:hypothetical protein